MGCNFAAISLQRKQDFYENGVICIFILQETKAAPFLFVYKSATRSECPHQNHKTWEMRGRSLECIRNDSASEQPGEMLCTQTHQSSLHCTPSTHIDGLNGAKLLQETSHILLSCPFVQLSYPECGTANYNQELAQVVLTAQITNTYPMLNAG